MKLLLNVLKRDNYVFFDPANKLHLSLGSPVGFADMVSSSVSRAVIAGNIIDIDEATGIEISDEVKASNEYVLEKMGYKKSIVKSDPTSIFEDENVETVEEVRPVEEVITTIEEKVEAPASQEKPKRNKKPVIKEEDGE